ncbi:hypothetical protein HK414_21355 [Ramlibacter terrae]|uniref:Lipoprotein n=1 Tax=Ramlibacter terrae TaxID=2732511 RepID=A0ABX6P7K9_9BURK|nr:hypothetical protein HK414_21355 [Ramlibacter terrae]
MTFRALATAATLALAGCAVTPADTCQLQHPPTASRIRVTHGVALATYPGQVPADFDGCQRTWIGDERELAGMRVLATAHFAAGRVVRFEGTPPDGPAYVCRYVAGRLDAASSSNARNCPVSASQLEAGSP